MQKRKVSSTFKREKISLQIQERIYPLAAFEGEREISGNWNQGEKTAQKKGAEGGEADWAPPRNFRSAQ